MEAKGGSVGAEGNFSRVIGLEGDIVRGCKVNRSQDIFVCTGV